MSGRVNRAIFGDEVVLHSLLTLMTTLVARTLSVAEGAIFDGRSRKFTDSAEVAPQVEVPVI